MKVILTVLTFVSSWAFFASVSMGQSWLEIREGTKKIVERKYPELKMTSKLEEENRAFYKWYFSENEKERWVVVNIFYEVSRTAAAKQMDRHNLNLPSGPGRKRTDLGDNAFFSVNEVTGAARIRFSKANVYFTVGATSLTEAELLARSFEKLVKKK